MQLLCLTQAIKTCNIILASVETHRAKLQQSGDLQARCVALEAENKRLREQLNGKATEQAAAGAENSNPA